MTPKVKFNGQSVPDEKPDPKKPVAPKCGFCGKKNVEFVTQSAVMSESPPFTSFTTWCADCGAILGVSVLPLILEKKSPIITPGRLN